MTTSILARNSKKSSPSGAISGAMTPYPTSNFNQNPDDSWSPDGQVFIHYGKGYVVAPNLATICIGPVDADGKPLENVFKPPKQAEDISPDTPEKPPAPQKGVSKLMDMETVGVNGSQTQSGGSFETSKTKHPGGRPKKPDNYSRITRWRRKKEAEQGVLL